MKPLSIIGLVIIGYVAVRVLVLQRESGQGTASQPLKAERPSEPDLTPVQPPAAAPSLAEQAVRMPNRPEKPSPPPMQPVKPESPAKPPRASATVETPQKPLLIDPAVKEQLGRLALSFAGADPDADEVWAWLINDPDLSANARQDLIEDLNEEGFDDPRNLTADDLPLIENRILLIEEHAAFAMDDVNADAFAEAYKDLINMWLRVTQQ